MHPAPIALFVYKRTDHLKEVINSLKKNDLCSESDLFIYSDGPKNKSDIESVNNVRDYISTISGFKNINIIKNKKNNGLANSIINGVTSILNKYDKVVVLEDDLIVSPHFLEFMNYSLEKYKTNKEVMQISGYMYPVKISSQYDSFFMPLTTSWGWATWQDSWSSFDKNMKGYELLENNKKLRSKFNLGNTIDYFNMLEKQKAGLVDSWAIRWYLSVFMNNGLVLYPRKTLVRNIGMDGTGTHGDNYELEHNILDNKFMVNTYPDSIKSIDMEIIQKKIKEINLFKQPLFSKLFLKIRNLF